MAATTTASSTAALAGRASNTNVGPGSKESATGGSSAADLSAAALALSLSSGPPQSIKLDGLALTKLVKHSRDAHPGVASGLLLGLDLQGALEVTNVFGLPRNALRTSNDDDDNNNNSNDRRGNAGNSSNAATSAVSTAATRHITAALSLLSSVNADANPVGIYISSFLGFGGAFTSQVLEGLKVVGALIDKEGGQKAGDGIEKAVVLVHDLAQSAQGNTVIKAFRLSQEFVAAFKSNNFTAKGLVENHLTFSQMFIELPLSLHNTALLDAFISTLSTPSQPAASILPTSSSHLLSQPPRAAIERDYTNLTLAHTPVLSSALEQTLDQVDDYLSEAGNVGFQSRQLARDRIRLEANLSRKKQENLMRTQQGLEPINSVQLIQEEERKLDKLLKSEPNRLETTLMLGALDAKARRTAEESAASTIRLEGARAGTA